MPTIRRFDPASDDYETIVAIYNANWSDERHYTAELWRAEDNIWPEGSLQQRFVAEVDGRIIGMAACYEKFWAHQPGTVHVDFLVDPAYQETGRGSSMAAQLFDHILGFLRRRNPPTRVIASETREDRPERIRFLHRRGFKATQRSARSYLQVASFDASRYATLLEKLAAQDIAIRTLTELHQRDPQWKQKLYDLRWAIIQDVPSVEPPTRPSMAEFESMILEDPALNEEAWFIALDESAARATAAKRWIGMSNLWLNDPDLKRLDTGLTGVLPAYRRQGIASALKLRTIDFARRLGALTIETSNEENNPMFDLNSKLGFQPKSAWVSYRWELP